MAPRQRKPLRRLPIERYIEDGTLEDRRTRWESVQKEAGFVRVTVRCHVEDVEAVKRYAARALRKRVAGD